ncbi:MAG: XRE family transcriptional regulator [Treponema sp.]|jgi:transcriptional regulator with XRE-family HTH domain|nr:XRE family transcriptional regulator [Treponema sp.]
MTTLGEHIVELCKIHSVSIEELAERSGLSLELIRRITKNGHIPDLAPLVKIARTLGVRLGTFLDDYEDIGPVVVRAGKANETPRFITGVPNEPKDEEHKGLLFKALAAHKGGRHMEPFIVDIAVDAEQTESIHEGEEFIYVLNGAVSIKYGVNSYVLNKGDSIYYDSIVPHCVLAADNAPASILAVIYAPV